MRLEYSNVWVWIALLTNIVLTDASNSQELERGQIRTGFEILDGPIQRVFWCGQSHQGNRLLLTSRGTLYTSPDHGFNWTSLKPTLQAATFVAGGKSGGVVRTVLQHPTHPSLVVFQGNRGVSWASNNCGKSVKVLRHGKQAFRIQLHPQFANHMLAGFVPTKKNPVSDKRKPLLSMWLSKDWGETWSLLRRNVLDFGWGCSAAGHTFDTIVALVKKDPFLKYSNKGQLLVSSREEYSTLEDLTENRTVATESKYRVVVSEDSFKTEWILLENANRLVFLPHYILATSLTAAGLQLFVADIDGSGSEISGTAPRHRLERTYFPSGYELVSSVTLAHTASQRVCLASGTPSTVLCSDSYARTFSQEFAEVETNQFGMVDFICVQGLDGVCLANRRDKSTWRNKGWGSPWQQIHASGCEATDQKHCRLFVHSMSSLFAGKLVSSSSAPGLVVVSGETVKHGEGVYLSQDGTDTWRFVARGKFIFNFADQGGLLILAPTEELTDRVLFSWDYGTSFVSLKFTQEKIYLVRLRTDPHKKGVFFFLEGLSQGGLGISIPLDFSFLMPRVCQDDDFEVWFFNSTFGGGCLNGVQLQLLRRRPESNCFIPDKLDLVVSKTPCSCSDPDVDCYPGLNRVGSTCGIFLSSSGTNKPQKTKTADFLETPPKNCEHSYRTRSAYRKARDSECEGFSRDDSRIELCPARKFTL